MWLVSDTIVPPCSGRCLALYLHLHDVSVDSEVVGGGPLQVGPGRGEESLLAEPARDVRRCSVEHQLRPDAGRVSDRQLDLNVVVGGGDLGKV